MGTTCLPAELMDRIVARRQDIQELADEANAALDPGVDLDEALRRSAQLTFDWGSRHGILAALLDQAEDEVKSFRARIRTETRSTKDDKGKSPSVDDCKDAAETNLLARNTERFIADMKIQLACLGEAKWAFSKRHEAILALSQRELWEQSTFGKTSVTDTGPVRPTSTRVAPRPQVGPTVKKDPKASINSTMNKLGGKKSS